MTANERVSFCEDLAEVARGGFLEAVTQTHGDEPDSFVAKIVAQRKALKFRIQSTRVCHCRFSAWTRVDIELTLKTLFVVEKDDELLATDKDSVDD